MKIRFFCFISKCLLHVKFMYHWVTLQINAWFYYSHSWLKESSVACFKINVLIYKGVQLKLSLILLWTTYCKIIKTNEVRILLFVFNNADHTFIEFLGPMSIFMTARRVTKHLNFGCSLDLCMYTDTIQHYVTKIPLIIKCITKHDIPIRLFRFYIITTCVTGMFRDSTHIIYTVNIITCLCTGFLYNIIATYISALVCWLYVPS